MTYIKELLRDQSRRIAIVSGEGECGTAEPYAGKRSPLAIKRRLTKECCGGDRWAYAVIEADGPQTCDGYAVTWTGGNDLGQAIFPGID